MPTTIDGTTGVSQIQGNTVTSAKVVDGTLTGADLSGAQTGTAPIFGARAWCVFDGSLAGTNAPTSGGNVTSVTRNSTGNYTVTFATAMPDANYVVLVGGVATSLVNITVGGARSKAVGSFVLDVGSVGTSSVIPSDRAPIELVVLR